MPIQRPVPRSRQQRLGAMIDGFQARQGVGKFRPGCPVLSVLETAAQEDDQDSQDLLAVLALRDLDACEGDALDQIGAEEGVPRPGAVAATAEVDFSDTSFPRVATELSASAPPALAGATALRLADGRAFPPTGRVHLGRGTANYEGPVSYTGVALSGGSWVMTLGSATQHFHPPQESVVLAQGGDRVVPAGTAVVTPQGLVQGAVRFVVRDAARLPDGEVSVSDVLVVAVAAGSGSNVAAGALSRFDRSPFAGAAVTNPRAVTNGRDAMRDPQYRDLIRQARRARPRGVAAAVAYYASGVEAPDQPARVTSATYLPAAAGPATLVVDDGTGYEATSAGVAFEELLSDAVGGEDDLALSRWPLAPPALYADEAQPWALVPGDQLCFSAAGWPAAHTFDSDQVPRLGAAGAYDVAAACNADPALGWRLRTTGGGRGVRAEPRGEADSIQYVPTRAGARMGFPARPARTLRLYRDDRLMSQVGRRAVLWSRPVSAWAAVAAPQTLAVRVDRASAPVTYTFTDADFAELTEFRRLGRNTPEAWARVLDARVTGCGCAAQRGQLALSSNRGASADAAVEVVGGTLVAAGFFAPGRAVGAPGDYALDRFRGLVRLAVPARVGERITAGTTRPEPFLEAEPEPTTTLATDATWWLAADAGARSVAVGGLTGATVTATTYAEAWGLRVRLAAPAGTFSSVAAGDWLVLWDDAFSARALRAACRVTAVAQDGSWAEVAARQNCSPRAESAATLLADGRVLVSGGWTLPGLTGATASCEVYDPVTRAWSVVGDLHTPRAAHCAVLLPSGKVLAFGGTAGGDAGALAAPELYDPVTRTWSQVGAAGAPSARHHAAAAVAGGKAYVAGGRDAAGTELATTYVFDPAGPAWSPASPMNRTRAYHTLDALGDGHLYAVGGQGGGSVTATVEEYDPGADTWTTRTALQAARQSHRTALLDDGRLLVCGGATATEQAFRAALAGAGVSSMVSKKCDAVTAGAGAAAVSDMAAARSHHGLSPLPTNGMAVAALGYHASGATARAEVYHYLTDTWVTTSTPPVPWRAHLQGVAVGGLSAAFLGGAAADAVGAPAASSLTYDQQTDSWAPSSAVAGSIVTSQGGVRVARLGSGRLVRAVVPAGDQYTATSFVDALDAALPAGLSAGTARTTRLRVWSDSLSEDGSLLVAAADAAAQLVGLPEGPASADDAQPGFATSAPQEGTPSFRQVRVAGAGAQAVGLTWGGISAANQPPPSAWVAGLSPLPASAAARPGDASGWSSQATFTYDGRQLTQAVLRDAPERPLLPGDRAYLAAPYAFAAADALRVAADRDGGREVALTRRCATSGSYGASVTLRDAPASVGSAPLAAAFGTDWDWRDYQVLMRARAPVYGGDSSRAVLWRWWRFGGEGERATVCYDLPARPGAPVEVATDLLGAGPAVTVRLAGGAAKAGSVVRPTTMVGVAATSSAAGVASVAWCVGLAASSAQRAADVTTLTLVLPTGVTDHGVAVGDRIYFKSTSASFVGGSRAVTARTATTVAFADPGADAGPEAAPGIVSVDTAEASVSGAAPGAGDFLRVGPGTDLPAELVGRTVRLTGAGAQVLYAKLPGYSGGVSTTIGWHQLRDPAAWVLFSNPAQAASVVVAAVNAAYDAGASPVRGAVLGTGAGALDRSSAEAASAWPATTPLRDGCNAVSATNVPATSADDYVFDLKRPPAAELAAGPDWANDEVRLGPVSAAATARWLGSPANGGLGTVLSCRAAGGGRRVQLSSLTPGSAGTVQVTGGSANAWSASVRGAAEAGGGGLVVRLAPAEMAGFASDCWVRVELAASPPKTSFAGLTLQEVTAAGRWVFSGGSVWSSPCAAVAKAFVQVERQGRFWCVTDTRVGPGTWDLAGLAEGDWVVLSPPASPTAGVEQLSPANTGQRRVVRTSTSSPDGTHCVWIEGLGEEQCCEARAVFVTRGSPMPGDLFQADAALAGPNRGTWRVTSVGDGGGGPWTDGGAGFTVEGAPRAAAPGAALGAQAAQLRVTDQAPPVFYKQFLSALPDGSAVLGPSTAGWEWVNEANGAVVACLDKLGFPTELSAGCDAYRYSTGLVGEVARVEYGDPADPATYPGVVCAGAQLAVDGPVVRRARVALVVRVGYGPAAEAVAGVRAAVRAAFVQQPHGRPVDLSLLVGAARQVAGVTSVAVAAGYGPGTDLLRVRADEKFLVIDDSDVSVTVAAD